MAITIRRRFFRSFGVIERRRAGSGAGGGDDRYEYLSLSLSQSLLHLQSSLGLGSGGMLGMPQERHLAAQRRSGEAEDVFAQVSQSVRRPSADDGEGRGRREEGGLEKS